MELSVYVYKRKVYLELDSLYEFPESKREFFRELYVTNKRR